MFERARSHIVRVLGLREDLGRSAVSAVLQKDQSQPNPSLQPPAPGNGQHASASESPDPPSPRPGREYFTDDINLLIDAGMAVPTTYAGPLKGEPGDDKISVPD